MADLKISQLPAATTPLAGTEPLPIVQSSATEQVTVANLTSGRAVSCLTLQSTATTGTAPFTVASTTNVANLNASSLNGATFAAPGAIGSGTAGSGAFTTLSASSTVSGAGFSTYLASPPAIGGTAAAAITGTTITANTAFAGPLNGTVGATTPSTGAFTTLSASSTVSGTGFSTYLASPPAIGGTAASTGRFTSVETTTGGVGAGTTPVSGAWVKTAAGTATVAPVLLTSGTNLTTPVAGAMEYDGAAQYFTADANAKRGIIPAFQFVRLASSYTTVSGSTALQQLFNTTASGAVTVTAGGVYEFECVFGLSSLSSTSGNVGFGFGGTATFTSVWYTAACNKGNNMQGTNGTAATNTNISAASTTTAANAIIKGILVINAGGTVVPSFSVTVAAAAVVNAGSFFKITNVSSNTSIGAWS